MNERELADLFDQEWEATRSGASRPGGAVPEPVRQALDTAWKVAQTDFSAESRARDLMRRRLLLGESSAGSARPARQRTGPGLAGWIGLGSFAAVMVLLVLGLSWVIRSSLPALTPLQSAAPSQVALVAPELSPAATAAVAPAATEMFQVPPPIIGRESLPDTIRNVMLSPAWDSLWIQGEVLQYDGSGAASTVHVQSWLDRHGGGRVTSSDALPGEVAFDIALEPRFVMVSQGEAPRLYDQQTGRFGPASESSQWDIHPLERANPLLEMVFPRDLPGSAEGLQVAGYASQAQRPAVILDWAGVRYWVDEQTGVLLRRQTRDQNGMLVEDAWIDTILYNPPIPDSVYDTQYLENAAVVAETPAGSSGAPTPGAEIPDPGRVLLLFEPVPSPVFGEPTPVSPVITQGPAGETQEPPAASPTPGPAGSIELTFSSGAGGIVANRRASGDLFFVMRSVVAPFDRQLAGVDAACLYTQASCPARVIPGLPEASDSGLHWSPGGEQAILYDSANARLLRYRDNAWISLAEGIRMTADLALWSPDGAQFAVTLEGSQAGDSLIHLVIPGADAESTEIKTLAADLAGIQVPLAWRDETNLIFFRHSTRQKDGSGQFGEPGLYRLDLRTESVSQIPAQGAWEWLKNYPAVAPDGSRLVAWTQVDGQNQLAMVDLARLNGAEYPPTPLGVDGSNPVWSPDGRWIAFTASRPGESGAAQPEEASSQVYIVRPDGSGLQPVFEWGTVPEVLWAPDSQHLIVVAFTLGSDPENDRTAFYLVSVPQGRIQQITLEAAYERYELLAPSFRPPSKTNTD